VRAFHFNLDRVREWRTRQLELEEAGLQQLLAEKASLKARAAALEREREAARQAVAQQGSATGQDLGALDAFFRYVAMERQKLAAAQTACERRICVQQQQVIVARRRVEVIERLREKRLADWRAGFDREQENLAAELFLAKWKKRGQGDRGI
jgi:flagellar export protein FliJ